MKNYLIHELRGNHCYWEVKAIHNIALVMDFTTLLTDIWIYVESYVPLMSPNEDETGLALLITSRESNSYSYIYIYIYIEIYICRNIINSLVGVMMVGVRNILGDRNFLGVRNFFMSGLGVRNI